MVFRVFNANSGLFQPILKYDVDVMINENDVSIVSLILTLNNPSDANI